MGPYDYYVYSNSLVDTMEELNEVPSSRWTTPGSGRATWARRRTQRIQYNIVRVDGQKSTYIPIMKQGGDTNTIQVVNGVRELIEASVRLPEAADNDHVVFDQSVFVKEAIKTVMHEGLIGLVLTSIMILLFLGNFARDCRRAPLHSALGAGQF